MSLKNRSDGTEIRIEFKEHGSFVGSDIIGDVRSIRDGL